MKSHHPQTFYFETVVPITCSREHAGKIKSNRIRPEASPKGGGKSLLDQTMFLVTKLPDRNDRGISTFLGANNAEPKIQYHCCNCPER